jgi:hypothetical protein
VEYDRQKLDVRVSTGPTDDIPADKDFSNSATWVIREPLTKGACFQMRWSPVVHKTPVPAPPQMTTT